MGGEEKDILRNHGVWGVVMILLLPGQAAYLL